MLSELLWTVESSCVCLCRLQDDPPVGVSGAPTDNDILVWNAVIFG